MIMTKNVNIYVGSISKLYADNIKLVNGEVNFSINKEVVNDNSLFYVFLGNYINMEYDCLLPYEEEATQYMLNVITRREEEIRDILLSNDENLIKSTMAILKNSSSCIYFEPDKLKKDSSISKKDLHTLIKTNKRHN